MDIIKLKEKTFNSECGSRIVGELNGQHIKLAKIKEICWHKHDTKMNFSWF